MHTTQERGDGVSKPLELKVHGTHEIHDGPGNITAVYHDTDYGRNIYDWKADQISQHKRLTDSELAAEVFSAIFHEAECEVRGRRIERGYPPHPGHPAVEHYVKQNREFGRQAGILERFATLPHYDEAAA